jgi:nucleoside-diphosphate-sugar epimerase
MVILVTGDMGYLGPVVVERLLARPDAKIVGLDTGYFAHCLTGASALPERCLDRQLFADVRHVDPQMFSGVDAVVHLAAISNDPIGNVFEDVTFAVNHRATTRLARLARDAGAKAFVFASSCSVYGSTEEDECSEKSPTRPLTAYARSKLLAEEDLRALADDDFAVTCLRFGTACGMSDRLRLDLVLNDFVAGATALGRIVLLSDGTPWRPLIHIRDMAGAIDWALDRQADEGGAFLAINAGSDRWNYRIGELAAAVADVIPNVDVVLHEDAAPDRRSYRASFALFERLAPLHQPVVELDEAVHDLWHGLQRLGFDDPNYRESGLIRLNVLRDLRERGLLRDDLEWIDYAPRVVGQ